MKFELEWISVNDSLPKIPEGKHAIQVFTSIHDPCFEECSPGHGSMPSSATWDGKLFKHIAFGPEGNWSWFPILDIITHWMYFPKAYQITNPGFSFDPKKYYGYLPVMDLNRIEKNTCNFKLTMI